MPGHKTDLESDLELLPLTQSEFHILLALTGRDRHGYGIMKDVEESTDGEVNLGPGTLYGSIKRLLERNWIREIDDRPDPALRDERRRYYRLTERGQRVAQAEAARLERLVLAARHKQLLPGRPPAQSATPI
jgi:DNA-binding PadR family transcriptional regulator